MIRVRHNAANSLFLQTGGVQTIPADSTVWSGERIERDLFSIGPDIRAEKEARQKFERVFRNNPALMSLFDVGSHVLVDANNSFLATLGYSRQELIGRTFAELALFVRPFEMTELLVRLTEDERPENQIMQIRCQTGVVLDGLFSWEQISNQGGKLLLMVMIDISDLEGAKRQLRLDNDTLEHRVKGQNRKLDELRNRMLVQHKMASLGRLAAGGAHELNMPINILKTNFCVLQDYFSDLAEMICVFREQAVAPVRPPLVPCETRIGIDDILSDIPVLFSESMSIFERIARIFDSMREFAHTDLTAQFVLFDINAGIEETLVIARNTYKYCAEMRTSYGDFPEICCVPDLLRQVFLNLLVNSVHAIEAENRGVKGMIEITTVRRGDHVLCTFADDGPGVPETIRHRVFEPFFTTKPPGKGTGLGLSLCHEIVVKRHRGKLSVSSRPGGGAVFTLQLPIRQETAGSPSQDNGK